ncbi:hypothetical protein [Paraferrimonas sedimenticola]|uniref:DUF2157 domain-containing protein n=1 Tax=Paraferrimonas sedimenticola TaxID=375674 RepID=A0AA37RWR7_9GAMM|nr:hypothetical protein [Paraferrimonas sedimenticola]GLP96645.1 hypothetical protein GCM10007895_19510 [Paraferrimonas sedimenticola]
MSQKALSQAVEQGIISQAQADALLPLINAESKLVTSHLEKTEANKSQSSSAMSRALYYLGAVIGLFALWLLLDLGWELWGGFGVALLAAGYAVSALALSGKLLPKDAGLIHWLLQLFVCGCAPLLVFGLFVGFGWWQPETIGFTRELDGEPLTLLLVFLAACIAFGWKGQMSLWWLPISFAAWILILELSDGLAPELSWRQSATLTLSYGLVLMGAGYALRLKLPDWDGASLLSIGGGFFWLGLTARCMGVDDSMLLYLAANLALIGLGSWWQQRSFWVLGCVGVVLYLGYLAYDVFKDSVWLPAILVILGLGVVTLGALWQRRLSKPTLTTKSQPAQVSSADAEKESNQ